MIKEQRNLVHGICQEDVLEGLCLCLLICLWGILNLSFSKYKLVLYLKLNKSLTK